MTMYPWWSRLAIIALCALATWLLVGCSDSDDDDVPESQKAESVEILYDRAADLLAENKYKQAMEAYEEVERQHPFSPWAVKAQIMAGYSAYRDEDYTSAQAILERFVKLHPNHNDTPYAYYLRALTFYDQITDVGSDQKMTQDAQQALQEIISRYPESDYARDAKIKLDLTLDHLAGKEMEIGRYYLQREDYLAAINRFQFVLEKYQTTSHIPEALHRLVEAYMRLGVKAEAQKYAAVLGYNYPGSEWYEYSYAMLNGELDPKNVKPPKGSEQSSFWGGLTE